MTSQATVALMPEMALAAAENDAPLSFASFEEWWWVKLGFCVIVIPSQKRGISLCHRLLRCFVPQHDRFMKFKFDPLPVKGSISQTIFD